MKKRKDIKISKFKKGSTLWVQNAAPDSFFYILKSGLISIHSDIKFHDKRLNYCHPGDVFGLAPAVTRLPHQETLMAEVDSVVVGFPLNQLSNYLKKNRETYIKIISYFCDRLRLLSQHLSNTHRSGDEDLPEQMLKNARIYQRMGQEELACHALVHYIKWIEEHYSNDITINEARDLLNSINPDYKLVEHSPGVEELQTGTVIFVEGEPSDFFYLIKSGTVQISKIIDGTEFILSILGEGEFFGEMAVINQTTRNGTAIVHEDSVIQCFGIETFLGDEIEAILFQLFGNFARRIRYAKSRIFMHEVTDPNQKMYIYMQMLINDELAKTRNLKQQEYTFHISLDELKKMIGMQNVSIEDIHEFLNDPNIQFDDMKLTVQNKIKIDNKVITILGKVNLKV